MPQIKSQKKRVKTNNKAHKLVVSKKSALKSSIKAVLAAVDAKDKEWSFAVKITLLIENKKDHPIETGYKKRSHMTS